MANNRMYLKNTRTGERLFLAKYYPSTGWFTSGGHEERFQDFLHQQDFGHLTEEQLEENRRAHGFTTPHKSLGGMYGAEYVLELEDDG